MNKKALALISLWLPVAIQMGLIFYFSSQPSGSPALDKFPLPAGIGHLGGYGLLALLLYRAFNGSFLGWSLLRARHTFIVALLYGISDEFHQYFVPGRHATVTDVLINAAGIILALLALRFLINGLLYKQGKIFLEKFKRCEGFLKMLSKF